MKVAVIGLGAAGLRAAMLLERAGATVSLFEARKRIGGRIHTIRKGKTVYDAGGEWLDADHYRTIGKIETSPGARTSLFVPELRRLFVAVPHRGKQGAEVRVFEAESGS